MTSPPHMSDMIPAHIADVGADLPPALLVAAPILVFLLAYWLVRRLGPGRAGGQGVSRAGAPGPPSHGGHPAGDRRGGGEWLASSVRKGRAGFAVLGRGWRSWVGSPARIKLPVAVAAIAGVLSISVLRFLGVGGERDHVDDHRVFAAQGCIGLSIAASPDKDDLLAQMAAGYEKTRPAVRGRCVDVTLSSKTSGVGAGALARGWDEAADGPRPDVWSPAATSWVTILRQRLAERDAPSIVPDKVPPIATSPLVFAMPRPMA
ncbi:MAG: substrate-binding domain-containing protein, partial [Actinomycetota bacterium]